LKGVWQVFFCKWGKKNSKKTFEFSFSIAQEKLVEVFSAPKIPWQVFLLLRKLIQIFFEFFLQLPKKNLLRVPQHVFLLQKKEKKPWNLFLQLPKQNLPRYSKCREYIDRFFFAYIF
jgi:hypothetical protein